MSLFSHRWAEWKRIYGILLLIFTLHSTPVYCDCWESCFVPSQREGYILEYEQVSIFKIQMSVISIIKAPKLTCCT